MDDGVILTSVLVLLQQETRTNIVGALPQRREKSSPADNTSAMPNVRS